MIQLMEWRLIPYTVSSPAWNMALDEAIFTHYARGESHPTMRFYGWDPPTVSLGYFQDLKREINLTHLINRGFGLVRRNTGGRAVLHDRELTYAVIAGTRHNVPNSLIESYLYISQAFVGAFREFGVAAELHQGSASSNSGSGACFDSPSWYELTVNRCKLVGSAQLRQKDAFLQHGSILIDFSAEDLVSVLNLSEEATEKALTLLNRKVTSFRQLGVEVTPQQLAEGVAKSFESLYPIHFEIADPSPSEMELAHLLMKEKYQTDEWNLYRGKSENKMRLQFLQEA